MSDQNQHQQKPQQGNQNQPSQPKTEEPVKEQYLKVKTKTADGKTYVVPVGEENLYHVECQNAEVNSDPNGEIAPMFKPYIQKYNKREWELMTRPEKKRDGEVIPNSEAFNVLGLRKSMCFILHAPK